MEKLPALQTSNVANCIAIFLDQNIYYKKRESAYDGKSFKKFIKVLVDIVQLMNYEKVCLVMDNCHYHRDEDISDICSDIVQYRFIPPYSPNLNPIENIIGNIKNMRKLL